MKLNSNSIFTKAKRIWLLILVSGILEFFGAIYFYSSTSNFLKIAKTTNGEVIKLIATRSSNNGTTYAPVFKFQDLSGKTHTIHSKSSSSPASFEVGEEVEVFFNPKNPKEAKLNGVFELWGASIILGIMAVVSILSGLFFISGRR